MVVLRPHLIVRITPAPVYVHTALGNGNNSANCKKPMMWCLQDCEWANSRSRLVVFARPEKSKLYQANANHGVDWFNAYNVIETFVDIEPWSIEVYCCTELDQKSQPEAARPNSQVMLRFRNGQKNSSRVYSTAIYARTGHHRETLDFGNGCD